MADLKKEVGRVLRSIRTRNGLTTRHVAELSGMSMIQLSRIERGECEVTTSHIEKFGEGLGLDDAFLWVEVGRLLLGSEARAMLAKAPQ